MNAFPEDRNLQHVGCAAVANLAIGNAPNAARLVKAGARLAVQRALQQFYRVRVSLMVGRCLCYSAILAIS